MLGEAEHFEQLNGVLVNIREHNAGTIVRRGVDNAEQDRDADAVDDLGLGKADYLFLTSRLELAAALVLDLFAA